MSLLNAQSFKVNPDKLRPVKVEVPELGGHVFMRPLLAREMPEVAQTESKLYTVHFLAKCLCDEQGAPLFPDPKDAEVLLDHPAGLLLALGEKAHEVSGMKTEKKS